MTQRPKIPAAIKRFSRKIYTTDKQTYPPCWEAGGSISWCMSCVASLEKR